MPRTLTIESIDQPIPVKKQEKYNIIRWGLTGRDDLDINTKCFGIFKNLETNNAAVKDWQKLCLLWSSDFRTHINQSRWQAYKITLNRFYKKWVKKTKPNQSRWQAIKIGNSIKTKFINKNGKNLTVKTNNIKVILNCQKGLAIKQLWFKSVSSRPLIGTIPFGSFSHLGYLADFFTGHLTIEQPGKHKITDLDPGEELILKDFKNQIKIKSTLIKEKVSIYREIVINQDSIVINKSIVLPQKKLAVIRPFYLTLLPLSWDIKTLYFACHNGGYDFEKYKLNNLQINHLRPISYLVSASQALGATQGTVRLGDKNKELIVTHNQTLSALLPMIYFGPVDKKSYLMRLIYSAVEIDETSRENKYPQIINASWRLEARNHVKY